MSKFILTLFFTILAVGSLSASASPQKAGPYQDLKAQAEQEGAVSVIVTLASPKPVAKMLGDLQNKGDQQSPPSFTQQQQAFIDKLGGLGVFSYHFFAETASILLKLDGKALERIIAMKEAAEIVPAPDIDALANH